MRRRLLAVGLILTASLAADVRRRAVYPAIDPARSLVVTDPSILEAFPFERVMNALSGGRALALYQQWMDTQNPAPGLDVTAPHCDDSNLPTYGGSVRRCPTPEGALARTDPFHPAQYVPLALVNRFDMAPADGANCGQYRIVYARKGVSAEDRLHVIFEAVLPNPNREAGIAGCRPVAELWASLSTAAARRARLEHFFFDQVVKRANYSSASGGGIRAFHHTANSGAVPRFYQYRLDDVMRPDALENTPPATLFDATIDDTRASRFRDDFIRQIPTLAIHDVNGFFINVPREFLLAEGESGSFTVPFNDSFSSREGQQFNARIEAELARIGSTLKPSEVLRRAGSLTCGGCHTSSGDVGDGLSFPASLGFEHISDDRTLSPAMKDVFLPKRMQILRDFLATGAPPVRSN